MLLGKNNNSMLLLLCSHRWTDEMDKNQAESTKNFASYTITEGLVVSMSSVMHIVGYVLWD